MRIGIDVRMIFEFPTGIGNYRKSLMEALFEIDHENDYILVGNSNQRSAFSAQLEQVNISFGEIKSKANHPQQHLLLRRELQKLNLDVFYTTPWGATLGLPCKYVLEIPDLIYHHYPQFGSWKSKLYELFLEKPIARNAEHVVTISDFVKTDIHNYLGVDLDDISNMKGDVSSDYRVIEDEKFINNVLEKYGLVDPKFRRGNEGVDPVSEHGMTPFFVYLGNQRPHKNLVSLLKAFEIFKDGVISSPHPSPLLRGEGTDVKLVIIGGVDASGRDEDSLRIQKQLGEMKYKDDVMLLGKVFDNNEVAAIFNRAIAMVHPSMHEGFGMTPLEAMRCGCPIIASNVTAMPEVVGEAGILIDPLDQNAIATAMYELFTNQKLNKDLKQKSLTQSKLFSWEKTARILLDVFSKLK